MERVRLAILGATGSIGRSALAVVDQHPDRFEIIALSAHRSTAELEALVHRYRPRVAVISGARAPTAFSQGTRWLSGPDALLEAAAHPEVDVVLNALVGAAGLGPTLAALRAGKRLALANKESLVCGGNLVLQTARAGGGELVPVDSEHSAILQCLHGPSDGVRRLILTASGGPFRCHSRQELEGVTPADALRHPTWDMGAKITIDSATLANKALEVIEAHYLFGVPYERIEAVVHPQSIIHSMVEFVDGSVLAQMGFPTMEIPILYAFTFPRRLACRRERFDPISAGQLSFEAIRHDTFPVFSLGVSAGRTGGTAPLVFNAANEVAVAAFLDHRLSFPGIASVIEEVLGQASGAEPSSLDAVLEHDSWARTAAEALIRERALC